MQDDLKTAAAQLPDAIDAAGHPPAAVHVATVAAQRGLAPSTTVQLLEGVHQPAAALAWTLLGSAADASDSGDAPSGPTQKPSQQMSAAIRARLGIGTDRAA